MANNEFGSQFFDEIALAKFDGKCWSDTFLQPSNKLIMHPANHALHYASACFEGLKAFKSNSGDIHVFRLDDYLKRMQNSARGLYLPVPNVDQLKSMIIQLLTKYREQIPSFPGSAYIRPTLLGTDTSIGRAAAPSETAILFVLISPVGNYFSLNNKIRLAINTDDLRCAPHIGYIKSGSNYASAISLVMDAVKKYNADQVLFAPNGDVQETAATNCLLINNNELLTKNISSEFLPGITRDSILQVAKYLGYKISERNISVDEFIKWSKNGEIALSGTAAVLVPVSEFVYKDNIHIINGNKGSENTIKLRKFLNDIQIGTTEDRFNWITKI